jgi:hypothetical protein
MIPAALFLFVLAAGSAAAGAADFGIKGGINIANIHGEDPEDEGDWKNGFAGGVFIDLGITPLFALQPEILYVQNGSKTTFLEGEWSLKFNYLQVPVLAKVDLPVGGSLVPVLYAGGYAGLLLDSKLTVEAGNNSGTIGLKDNTKSYDAGLVFGAALDFTVGTGTMTIEGRYNLGMVEIDDGIGGGIFGIEEAEKTDMKNESWMVMASYAF